MIPNQPAFQPVDVEVRFCYGVPHKEWIDMPIIMGDLINNSAEFQLNIAHPKDDFYDQLLKEPRSCNDFSSVEEVNNYWQSKINDLFSKFRQNVIGWYGGKTGIWDTTGEKKLVHELDIHSNLQELIDIQFYSAKVHFGCP